MQIFIPEYKIWKGRGLGLENGDVSLTETEIRRTEKNSLIGDSAKSNKVPYHLWVSVSSCIKQGNELACTQSG